MFCNNLQATVDNRANRYCRLDFDRAPILPVDLHGGNRYAMAGSRLPLLAPSVVTHFQDWT